jgi:nucleoside-diphosphate-sugar epimerase
MNILITGATGFIGKHLTAALSKTYSVRCLVRKTSDIKELRDLNVDLAYGDLLDKNSLAPTLDGIDLVFHLAGEVYSRKKEDYYRGNILATQNLLEACKQKGTKRIIFLSSTGVYKPTYTKELLDEESKCEPISIYGQTKLDAEGMIKKYHTPWVIVRAPVIYGPSQKSVLNRFFLDAINKRKMYIFGSGDNLRSLCFIDNLVEGLVLLANIPNVDGKTYILSDDSPYTYNEMIEPISKALQQKLKLVELPSFLGNISWGINCLIGNVFGLSFVELYAIKKTQFHEAYDISKAKKEIGYCPSINLEEGMKSTIDWVRKTYIGGQSGCKKEGL